MRFKDTLFEFPDLRESWFRFHANRMQRRASQFLADEGLVGEVAANQVLGLPRCWA